MWHPPMPWHYSYRTHDGRAMLLAGSGGYPREWIVGPKLPGLLIKPLLDTEAEQEENGSHDNATASAPS